MVIHDIDVIKGTLAILSAYTPLIQIWTGICLLFFYVDLLSQSPLKGVIMFFNDKTYKASEAIRNRIQGVIFDKHFTLTDDWEKYKSRVKNMAAITFFYCLFLLFLIGMYRYSESNQLFSRVCIVSVDIVVMLYLITCSVFNWKIFRYNLTPIIYIVLIGVVYFCQTVFLQRIEHHFIEICANEKTLPAGSPLFFLKITLFVAFFVCVIKLLKVIVSFRHKNTPKIRNFIAAIISYCIVFFTIIGFCNYHFENDININDIRTIIIYSIIVLCLLFFYIFDWSIFRKYFLSIVFLLALCILYAIAFICFEKVLQSIILLCSKCFKPNEISSILACLSFMTCILGLLLVILHISRDFVYVAYNFILAFFINSRIQKIYSIASKYILLSPGEFNKRFIYDRDLPRAVRIRCFAFYKDYLRKNIFNLEEMQGNQLIDFLINKEFDSYLNRRFLRIGYQQKQKEEIRFSIGQENQLGSVIDDHLTSFFNNNDVFLRAQLRIGSTLYKTKANKVKQNNNKRPKRKH